MADLVLGLAKSAVEGTLTAARSAVEEEEKLKKNMQRDLRLISDEFEMMRSFLNVAKEHATDEMVSTLVRQVRNMALDVEDCIESVVLVDIKNQWWRRLLPYCILSALPAAALDDAVTAIEVLKSRVEAMGQRNERYMHVGNTSSKPSEKMHQQDLADARALGLHLEAKDGSLIDLIDKIDGAFPLQVISLWGAAGDLGVASIIKKTCDDPKICKKFRFRAWVKLTHPFNPHEFIRSLLLQFYTNCCAQQGSSVHFRKSADVMKATQDVLIEEFMEQVKDQRYLVFLEDVPSFVDWEAVRVHLPDMNKGSCIVVHTQQPEVASLCVGKERQVLKLEQSSRDHPVFGFYNKNKDKMESSPQRDLIDLIKKVQTISVYKEEHRGEVANIIKETCKKCREICIKFKYRASVKLRHPFDPQDFISSLITQFCTTYCRTHGSNKDFLRLKGVTKVIEEGALINEFVKEVLSSKSYLIFLEDLDSKDDLEAVRKILPANNNDSCIVVHTQKPEVAKLCVGESPQILTDQHGDMYFDEDDGSNCDDDFSFDDFDDDDQQDNVTTRDARTWLLQHGPKLVGRKADIECLRAKIPGVHAVFGMAGVGKSHIVKHAYYSQVTGADGNNFQMFGWVDLSHPFNIRDFSWSLLNQLNLGSLQHGNMTITTDPIQECRSLLNNHACLIVIDGLKTTEEWDLINSHFEFDPYKGRSRIIVIANEKSVASHCSTNCWSVQGLEIDDALALFTNTAYGHRDLSPADIEKAKSVLHKCGGLPKVIFAVAKYMGWRLINPDCFMQALETNPGFGSLRDLFSWVASYFRCCPDSLKPCIFYLSIFPVNHQIRRMRLVRRWIAEGYSMDTKEGTAEERGKESCLELRQGNIIQVPGNLPHLMRMPSFHVNGFFREYIMSRSMEENLVFALEGHCSVNTLHTGRHLTIGSSWDRDISVYQSIDLSRLRSLTVFGRWESFFLSEKMKLVRVLDLEDASSVTDDDVELMVNLLPRLKFLSLRRCKEITRLPNSFGGLRQLQTLDIRYTSIVKLPVSITKLQKLQHICAGTPVEIDGNTSNAECLPPPPPPPEAAPVPSSLMTRPNDATMVSIRRLWTRRSQRPPSFRNGGIELPRGIGKMVALHNVSVIDVGIASGRPILEELKKLTQMRKLGVSGINTENCKELCSVISSQAHLKSLSLWLDTNQGGCLDSISQPPQGLQSLKLYGHVGKLPAWIKLPSNLRKLKLQMEMVTQEEIEHLTYLPSLDTLCLCSKEFQHGELRFRGAFPKLRVLEIHCNCRLNAVTFERGVIMHGLELLKICCCNISSLKFSGLEHLPNLREVSVSGSFDDKLKEHLETQLFGQPQRNIVPFGLPQQNIMPAGLPQRNTMTVGLPQRNTMPFGLPQRNYMPVGLTHQNTMTVGLPQRSMMPGLPQQNIMPFGLPPRNIKPVLKFN